jgi:hypothetical protein
MKTIKDINWEQWKELDFDEKLDVTINTMFVHGKINTPEKMHMEYADAIIELSSAEDNDKLALTEGWIKIIEDGGARIEINLWRENGQPYFTDEESMWQTVFNYLEGLEE